ncbi:hypothetical protein [Parasitella parasitica]|uniref:RZZ complex subunit KNTC1/ROD C-terminal domain-containing protein n=1 Tax=Parasitella parasitica TaxID=35722 RepID=A0A0B7N971_9FUNG|nr:hypothetical protein [Parasitella parasitica]
MCILVCKQWKRIFLPLIFAKAVLVTRQQVEAYLKQADELKRQTISLHLVAPISNQEFEAFVSSCPKVKDLTLFSNYSNRLEVAPAVRLISQHWASNLIKIRMDSLLMPKALDLLAHQLQDITGDLEDLLIPGTVDMRPFPKLEILEIENGDSSGEKTIRYLNLLHSSCPKLKRLTIYGMRFPVFPEMYEDVKPFSLTCCNLNNCDGIIQENANQLLRIFPNLNTLSLVRTESIIRPDLVDVVHSLHNAYLNIAQYSPQLRDLSIDYVYGNIDTRDYFNNLFSSLGNLQTLHLELSSLVKGVSLKEKVSLSNILTSAPHLKKLSIYGLAHLVTVDSLEHYCVGKSGHYDNRVRRIVQKDPFDDFDPPDPPEDPDLENFLDGNFNAINDPQPDFSIYTVGGVDYLLYYTEDGKNRYGEGEVLIEEGSEIMISKKMGVRESEDKTYNYWNVPEQPRLLRSFDFPPPNFTSNLTVLHLTMVTLRNPTFQWINACCPELKELSILDTGIYPWCYIYLKDLKKLRRLNITLELYYRYSPVLIVNGDKTTRVFKPTTIQSKTYIQDLQYENIELEDLYQITLHHSKALSDYPAIMSKLLLDNDENESFKVFEKNISIDGKDNTVDSFANELEKSVQEATADLPLGKALHLLLHVHGQVFDKAVLAIQNSTAEELAIKVVELAPIVKAILSIQNYISPDISAFFKQIYDSLKNKFIKQKPNEEAMRIISFFALHSDVCQVQVQQVLRDELRKSDKKDQLAVVILLHFFFKNYTKSMEKALLMLYVPLVHLVEKQSDQPTLLSFSACDLALQFTRVALTATPAIESKMAATTKIMEIEVSESVDKLQKVWDGLSKILNVLEKWQASKTSLETAAYEELRALIKSNTKEWNIILKYITPKVVLSEKPISAKRQRQILSDPDASSSTQLLLLTLFQKGEWIKLYTEKRSTVVTSAEQDEIKNLVQQKYKSLMRLKHLIPPLVTTLPHLFSCTAVKDSELIQSIINQIESPSDEMFKNLATMIMNRPEPSVCYLLTQTVQKTRQHNFTYKMLCHLITTEPDQIVPMLQEDLLSAVKESDQACNLLLKCMDFTDLSGLIRKLMKLSNVEDQREKMIYMALIAKALLKTDWVSSSILNYVDLVREFKLYKGFVTIDANDHPKTPRDTSLPYPTVQVTQTFPNDQVETISKSLMIPLQLWSARATEESFTSAIRQLVQYSYGLPKDGTWIEAWKQLSFAFENNHRFIWPVIETCTNIMREQISITQDFIEQPAEIKEKIIFFRLSPMLILQAIPKNAYALLSLPDSYVNFITSKLMKIGISKSMLKVTQQQDTHLSTCIQLMEELLQRSLDTNGLDQGIPNIIDFSTSLLAKLFCVD